MIVLFTDFGAADIYVGQVKAVMHRVAPQMPVVDLLHSAPLFDIPAAAHLFAALQRHFPPGTAFFSVIDPGVGGDRDAVIVQADEKWFVGPDNGLLSVTANRARAAKYWRITWRPDELSCTFHGRDLFAPICAWIARGDFPFDKVEPVPALNVQIGASDSARIIYIDHYGNAITGLRGALVARTAELELAAGVRVSRAARFSEVPTGAPFWYENSAGLIEVAVNLGNAAQELGLALGQDVRVLLAP